MRLIRHERLVGRYLADCQNRHCPLALSTTSSGFHRRHASTSSPTTSPSPPHIAVLGGGITGLVTAYELIERGAKVTLYEGSDVLGGWVRSKVVDLPEGRVVFERGPRTLRPNHPNGHFTAALIASLGLEEEMLWTARSSPAAQSRYIFYPDRLVEMPGPGLGMLRSIWSLLTQPIHTGAVTALIQEPMKPQRPSHVTDESIGDFITRRFSRNMADRLVSAVAHGIYAGDIWRLSAAMLLSSTWAAEGSRGSVLRGAEILYKGYKNEDVPYLGISVVSPEMIEKLSRAAFFTLKNGLQQMVDGLALKLRAMPNDRLTIVTNANIEKVESDGKDGLQLFVVSQEKSETFDQVVSTLPHFTNQNLFFDGNDAREIPYVDVGVVSFFFSDTAGTKVPAPPGFGYLIPQATPLEQNPELALGVVFDSNAVEGQDTAKGTKMTVMLGGHYWDSWETLPTAQECIGKARAVLARHLGITAEPTAVEANINTDCIPQYRVGHRGLLARKHQELLTKFGGRVKFAGAAYSGVAVNDCVRAGRDISSSIICDGWRQETGLENFTKPQEWSLIEIASGKKS